MTQPERELWIQLRAKRFEEIKFYRQFVIEPYIVDFAARARKLVIEIDGHTHTDASQDDRRTAVIERQGYRVIRFTNTDVMTNIEGVMYTIGEALGLPSPNPLPEGRGLLADVSANPASL